MYPDVAELLHDCKYTVFIKQLESGLLMYYPKGEFTKDKPTYEYEFHLDYDYERGVAVLSINNDKLTEIPIYAARYFTSFIIHGDLRSINYDHEYIVVQDRNSNYIDTQSRHFDLIDLLPDFVEDDLYKKEDTFLTIINDLESKGVTEGVINKARQNNVLEGLNFILEMVSSINNAGAN